MEAAISAVVKLTKQRSHIIAALKGQRPGPPDDPGNPTVDFHGARSRSG